MENAIGSAVSFVADKVIGAVATEVNEKVIVPKKIVLPMMIFSSSCYADMEMKRFTTILTPLSLSIMLSLYLVPLCVVNLAHSPSTSLPLLARIRNDS